MIRRQTGFTLIEIAIVLLIVTILIGYTVAMFPVQQELKQYRKVATELDEIASQLIGFAQVNGRLPCPDTNVTTGAGFIAVIDGQEDFADDYDNDALPAFVFDDPAGANGDNNVDGIPDGCIAYSGFLPAGTLGLTGKINPATGNLLDPWGQPYRYQLSSVDVDANGDGLVNNGVIGVGVDLVTPNGVRDEGLSNVVADLFICNDSTATGNHADCTAVTGGSLVVGQVVAVVLSTGKDRGTVTSNIQTENTDDFHDGTNDKVFVYSSRNDSSGSEYDDAIVWISSNQLYSKMIQAGQLP